MRSGPEVAYAAHRPSWAHPGPLAGLLRMASLTHTQTRSLSPSAGLYRVTEQVTASSDMPTEVFILRVLSSGHLFSRVATVDDLLNLGTTASSGEYYRVSSFNRDFSTLAEAKLFSGHVKTRLNALVKDYTESVASFLGTESETVSSS